MLKREVLVERVPVPWATSFSRWLQSAMQQTWFYALGAVVLVIYVTPFLWMILGSLRREVEIFQYTYPLTWHTFVPVEWSLKNFQDVLGISPEGKSFGLNFGRALINTALVSAGVVASSLVFNTMGAYFFSRLDFPRKGFLLLFVIATMLIPFEAVMVPLYIVVGSKELQTIQVAIAQQTTQTQVYWGRIFAGSVLASVPVILLFLAMQRYYVKGVVMSGLKG